MTCDDCRYHAETAKEFQRAYETQRKSNEALREINAVLKASEERLLLSHKYGFPIMGAVLAALFVIALL